MKFKGVQMKFKGVQKGFKGVQRGSNEVQMKFKGVRRGSKGFKGVQKGLVCSKKSSFSLQKENSDRAPLSTNSVLAQY